ncbi:hypothetical protein CI109_100951 [Kwoniella shandongensis]|uniref:Chromatin assembly factor 1 subunit A n=1 Tax=Kwoniella shandongensis TaxID=1734106 RepID=A0A5M6C4J5_9TREE|nr:uncharacterized protein CI109_001417 [Kwoniella shandongensis]KAA5530014.1 hypothetical protein CI109_001417 [Kwoniella shandongensis]
MAPNTILENVHQSPSPSPAGMKRKAGEDVLSNKLSVDEKENNGVKKRVKTEASTSSLVELKGRKLIFKQDPLPRNLPRRRLLKLETYLLDEADEGRKVTSVPEEHWDLIVMAGHELSSANENLFMKNLKSSLDIVKGGQDPLPSDALAPLIPRLFTLRQYGFTPSDFSPSASSSSTKIPAALQIRCWEANDLQKYYPAEQEEVLLARRQEREQARERCLQILDGLDDIEKLELVKGDKLDKGEKAVKTEKAEKAEKAVKVEKVDKSETGTPVKEAKQRKTKDTDESPRAEGRRKSREGTANTVDSRRSASPTKKAKMTPEEEEAARLKREEREAKKAAIAEKRAEKERAEKKKEAAKAKQAQTMSMFFKKPAGSPTISRASPAGPSTPKQRETTPVVVSDYAKTFRPMAQRPHVYVAEINKWHTSRHRSQGGSSEEGVSREQLEQWGQVGAPEVQNWQSQDFINDHLQRHGRRIRPSRSHLPKGLKTMPRHGTVADVWNAVQDAEDPRIVLDQLRNKQKFPWKTLLFDQQARPPYCGTFTKKSLVVGPRTPFGQDPIFDYSYDSGDEWQDDEGGEDVDDFGEGAAKEEEEDDDDDDEDEGEFDDWLDDAEDVEFTPTDGDVDAIDGIIAAGASASMDQSRLPMKVVKKSREIPKKVVKLTPTWKGPLWEQRLGEEGSEGMEGYRIQLLNDTPVAIDPFTFTSDEPVQNFKASFSTTAIGASLSVKCLLSTETIAPPKETPVSVNTAKPSAAADAAAVPVTTNGDTSTAAQSRSRAVGPKIAFPSTHLAELYRLIDGNIKIRTDLVSQLREHFEGVATKAAIEAKIKEVAVREGKTKESQWKVKADAWLSIGLTPPPATTTSNPTPNPIPAIFRPPPPAEPTSTPATAPGTADEPMIIDSQ